MVSGRAKRMAVESAWLDDSSKDRILMHLLRLQRRSLLCAARLATNAEEMRAAARQVRRWMRPLRRRINQERIRRR